MATMIEQPPSKPAAPTAVWTVAGTAALTSVPTIERIGDIEITMPIMTLEPYPCRCAPPCKTRGPKTCPCHGRVDLANLPPWCCARFEIMSSSWRAPDAEEFEVTARAAIPR
jgi:hypothetical protein